MDKLYNLYRGDRFQFGHNGQVYVLDHHDTMASHCTDEQGEWHILYANTEVLTEDDMITEEFDPDQCEYVEPLPEETETFWNVLLKTLW
jgi:hypothetical protein